MVLPGQSPHALKKRVEGRGIEAAHHQQDPLGKAGAQVGPGHGVFTAGEIYPSVFGRDRDHVHMAQLVAQGAFQPEQARSAEFQFHNISSPV